MSDHSHTIPCGNIIAFLDFRVLVFPEEASWPETHEARDSLFSNAISPGAYVPLTS